MSMPTGATGISTQQIDQDKLVVSIGPQHPGAGHFRFTITVDGDTIVDVLPDPGYVHRGAEKQTEYRNYIQSIPLLERSSLTDVTNIIGPFSLAAEELMGIQAPPRAQYLRMIMSENQRIISHLYWLGIQGIFLGHSTMFMWPLGDRDLLIDVGEMIGGARITYSYWIPGGVRNDMPHEFKERALKTYDYFEKRLIDYEKMFFRNPLVLKRTQGVGVLKRDDAINLGVVGPVLRASNVNSDTRRDEPYCAYNDVEFDVPVYKDCDTWSRCMVHLVEMRQSMRIIKQCLEKMPEGQIRVKLSPQQRAHAGEAYARVESARGAMAFHIISDGGTKPYRTKISVPSFRNLIVLKKLLVGSHVADMPAIYWSLDYWPVEADR
ncbi:MAG TPA: NADH-quinone oxidoreductase subunit D [Nitrososphaerales archaeon]|nr:NADH-quinone oxidoreductase subunit D [Nitrososphaerales archaeon]